MRAALGPGLILALAVIGGLLFFFAFFFFVSLRRPSGDPEPQRSVEAASETEAEGFSSNREAVRSAVPPSPAPEDPERSGGTDPLRKKDEEAFWRLCTGLAPAAVRDCIRDGLAGRALAPEELARMVCTSAPPDGADRLQIEQAVYLWQPEDVPQRIRAFQELCPASETVWLGLVRELLPRDPVWCARFSAALRPELAFSPGSSAVLGLVNALAEAGFEEQRAVLEAGARGDWGGSEQQIGFALTHAWGLQRDAQARGEFLSSVIRSPNFPARSHVVTTLVDCATDPAAVDEDVHGALGLVEELLSNPRVETEAARRLVELHQENRLSRWLTTGKGKALLERARALAGPH